jgi:DNA-binding NarL/FixJ family response regulator
MNKKNLISDVISIAIIEDITDIRETLKEFLKNQDEFLCELATESVEDFLKQVDSCIAPDIVLLDIGLPGISGINGMKFIKQKFPDVDIIMLTVYDDANKIFQSLCAGATGYLLKNTPLNKIKDAIIELKNGGAPMSPQIARKILEHFNPNKQEKNKSPLTDKEQLIVAGLVDGLSYKAIANNLGNSIETVRHHIKNIYRKLHVNSKAEVISKSMRGEI